MAQPEFEPYPISFAGSRQNTLLSASVAPTFRKVGEKWGTLFRGDPRWSLFLLR
jgi:hypothetical protein